MDSFSALDTINDRTFPLSSVDFALVTSLTLVHPDGTTERIPVPTQDEFERMLAELEEWEG